METRILCPEPRLALKASPCCLEACNKIAAAGLDGRPLCLGHFLSVSIKEMESRSASLKGRMFDPRTSQEFGNFLAACAEQAKTLSEYSELADSSEKLRLLELLDVVSRFTRRLRRSPRQTVSVPVWLRREDPRHTWEEETWTSTVSRHGAGFVCRHSVEVNGTVVLCRRDKGGRAEARVVYCCFDSEGRRHIGVELLDAVDFWGVAERAPSS